MCQAKEGNPELCSLSRLLTSHFDIYVYCLVNQQTSQFDCLSVFQSDKL